MKYHPIYLVIGLFSVILAADIVKPGIIQDLLVGKPHYREYPFRSFD